MEQCPICLYCGEELDVVSTKSIGRGVYDKEKQVWVDEIEETFWYCPDCGVELDLETLKRLGIL